MRPGTCRDYEPLTIDTYSGRCINFREYWGFKSRTGYLDLEIVLEKLLQVFSRLGGECCGRHRHRGRRRDIETIPVLFKRFC